MPLTFNYNNPDVSVKINGVNDPESVRFHVGGVQLTPHFVLDLNICVGYLHAVLGTHTE